MMQVQFSMLGVLIAAIIGYAIGGLWYSPLLFSRKWERLTGIKMKMDIGVIIIGFIATLITAYILAFAIAYTQATTVLEGLIVSALIWVGFIATTTLGLVIYERKPVQLYIINNTHYLLMLLAMSAILTLL